LLLQMMLAQPEWMFLRMQPCKRQQLQRLGQVLWFCQLMVPVPPRLTVMVAQLHGLPRRLLRKRQRLLLRWCFTRPNSNAKTQKRKPQTLLTPLRRQRPP
jgi:hypothetical protein